MMGQYAVVDADGCYGDYTTVWCVEHDLDRALGKAAELRQVQVLEGSFVVGQRISRHAVGTTYRAVRAR